MNMSSRIEVRKTLDVYAVIDGIPIALPTKAKYIFQDKRGCWFFCTRRPRIKDGDWTTNKEPIQERSDGGNLLARVLMTDVDSSWANTLQTTVTRAHLPLAI